MSKTALGLPPLTAALKLLSPFLQRAEEVKSQDKVIAYWCAYYAAQLGISTKTQDPASRQVLFELLDVLEHMKKEIGPNDALDVEAASSAYVENFALKVFSVADNDDRCDRANMATAKKFLAAANFLEVLNVFPKGEASDSHEEKIRYAKWKAADIAKAIREGRKPTTGPAGSEHDSVLGPAGDESVPTKNVALPQAPASPLNPPSSAEQASPQSKDTSLPPPLPPPPPQIHLSETAIDHPADPHTPPRHAYLGLPKDGPDTPSNWSTAATPGTVVSTPFIDDETGGKRVMGGFDASPLASPTRPGRMIGDEHFHDLGGGEGLDFGLEQSFPSPFSVPSLPFVPSAPPPSFPSQFPVHVVPSAPPAPAPDIVVELSPAVIAKAQKHARFAISALDYEDVEQSKKELRIALAILEGRS